MTISFLLKYKAKRNEAAYLEANKANREKDLFLATLSHELRTPLTSTFSWVQLLQTGKIDPVTTRHGLKKIEESVKNQERLINDLLDISRIIMGKIALEMEDIDPVSILNSAVDLIAPLVKEKSIRIIKHYENLPDIVIADRRRLQQIFTNLLTNAVKFTPKYGTISLIVKSDKGTIKLQVKDTGKGISPQFLPYVFNRFTQQDASSVRRYGGLGLGLSIVKSLVELQGGSVHAESDGEGQGSAFTVTLPIKPRYKNSGLGVSALCQGPLLSNISQNVSGKLEGLRVLVVEDDSNSLEALVNTLKLFEVNVKGVSSTKDALSALSWFKPQVLISDIAMPDQDGCELIRRIRSLPIERGGGLPSVALTAYVGAEDMKRALSSGFNFYLSKPVDSKILLETIAKAAV